LSRIESVVAGIAERLSNRTDRGEVASYIPELARTPIDQFGMAVFTADGETIPSPAMRKRPSPSRAFRRYSRSPWRSARLATGSGTGSAANRPATPSIQLSSWNMSRASRATPSSMRARSP
jgi:hypothetical protein